MGEAAHRKAESAHTDAREQRQLDGRDCREDRHDELFPRHEVFRESARAVGHLHGRAVRHRCLRDRRTAEHGADVGASVETVGARPALRRDRHDHLITDLHAPDLRADFFDDPDAAVAGDDGIGCTIRRIERGRRRIAGLRRLIPNHHLLRMNRHHRQRLGRQLVPVADERLECHARRLAGGLTLSFGGGNGRGVWPLREQRRRDQALEQFTSIEAEGIGEFHSQPPGLPEDGDYISAWSAGATPISQRLRL